MRVVKINFSKTHPQLDEGQYSWGRSHLVVLPGILIPILLPKKKKRYLPIIFQDSTVQTGIYCISRTWLAAASASHSNFHGNAQLHLLGTPGRVGTTYIIPCKNYLMTGLWKIIENQFTVCAFGLRNPYSFLVPFALSQDARNGCALVT